jgi:hypothetical protein
MDGLGYCYGHCLYAQLSDMAGAGSWATGLSASFWPGTAIIALYRGDKHITRGDWLAFAATSLAIPLWIVTSDPLWSVLLVTWIDAVAYFYFSTLHEAR